MSRIIIAGLGNFTHPSTRHSVGQVVLESLAAKWNMRLQYEQAHQAWLGRGRVETSNGKSIIDVTLIKPKLLMNISGPSITSVLRTFPSAARSPRNVVVLQDSLSHAPLAVSPKFGGSANGHNGVRSVIASLGAIASQFPSPRPANEDFHRIRLGIGRPAHKSADVASFVLAPLSREELDWWAYGGEGLNKVVKALEDIMSRQDVS
ncbi:peptidyl-tRNA hydrolase [Ceratobasidium sp. AG-I]|nr:peptidyl-tRNA hydrolase [Ceratobasidium sp. AG-I]